MVAAPPPIGFVDSRSRAHWRIGCRSRSLHLLGASSASHPHWPSPLPTLLFHLLSVFVLLLFLTPPLALHASYTPTFTVWGPSPIDPTAVQRVNSSLYNSTLPPVDYSRPILRLAGVITLLGDQSTYSDLVQSTYAWMLDSINMRGGLTVNGQPHLLSLTWTSDDSSLAYLSLLYSAWMADPTIALLLAPSTDVQLQSLLPLLYASNRTIFDVFAGAPVDIGSPPYPYAFYPLQFKNEVAIPSLNAINTAAQLHSATSPTSSSSPFGLTSLCIYTQQDSAVLPIRDGVLAWVNQTNTARLASATLPSDLVTVYVDLIWPASATLSDVDSVPMYEQNLDLCPDDVDLLMHLGVYSGAQFDQVAQAMASVQLRPKAAYTASTAPSFDPSDEDMRDNWVGWVTQGNEPTVVSTLPSPTFATEAEARAVYAAYYNTSQPASVTALLYPSLFEVLRAALSVATSLSSDDLRTAFLSLNGTTFLRRVQLDPTTGSNPASVAVPTQLTATSAMPLFITDPSQLVYPFDWPWRRLQPGDVLATPEVTPSSIIFAVVLGVLGCWVAQILLEQTIFLRRKGGLWQLWLLMVAFAFGGVGVCCCQLELSASWVISIKAPPLSDSSDSSEMTIRYSLAVALIALCLPGFLCSLIGLWFIVSDLPAAGSAPPGAMLGRLGLSADLSAVHTRLVDKDGTQIGVSSWRQRLVILLRHVTPRFVVGAAFIDASVWCTRLLLMLCVWCTDAVVAVSWYSTLVSAIVTLLVLNPALLLFCYAVRIRLLGVFGIVAAVYVDYVFNLSGASITYSPWALRSSPPSSGLYSVTLPTWAVEVFTGIIGAVSVFVFLGLQFKRMQLSRNGLTVLLIDLQSQVAKLKARDTTQTEEVAALRGQADAVVRMLEVINIVRPEGKEFAYALAQHAGVASMQQQAIRWRSGPWESRVDASKLLSPRGSPLQSFASMLVKGKKEEEQKEERVDEGKGAMATRVIARPTLPLPRVLGKLRHTRSSSVHPTATPSLTTSSSVVSEEDFTQGSARGARPAPVVVEEEGGEVCLVNDALDAFLASSAPPRPVDSTPPRQTRPITTPQPERRTLQPNLNRTKSVSSLLSVSASVEEVSTSANPSAATASHPPRASPPPSSNRHARVQSMFQRSYHRDRDSGGVRLRQFESEVTATLQAQVAGAEEFALAIAPQVVAPPQSPKAVEVLSPGGRRQRRSGEMCVRPTLRHLLHHPVCVELLKDEMVRLQCAELLSFYLLAFRYRGLQSAKLRRMVAVHLYDAFVAEGSEQQINLSTRQRLAIAELMPGLRKGDEGAASSALFAEAEAEVLQLMEVNVMRGLVDRKAYRLCTWVYNALNIEATLFMADGRGTMAQEHEEDGTEE